MGSGSSCFSRGVLLLPFSPLFPLCPFFVVFPKVRIVKINSQMASPFSKDSSMGFTEEGFALTAADGLEGDVGAFGELIGAEDGAVGCDDLAGAFGAREPDLLSGRDFAATFAAEPLKFLEGLLFGLDCFVVDFGFGFLLSPPFSS